MSQPIAWMQTEPPSGHIPEAQCIPLLAQHLDTFLQCAAGPQHTAIGRANYRCFRTQALTPEGKYFSRLEALIFTPPQHSCGNQGARLCPRSQITVSSPDAFASSKTAPTPS